MILTINSQFNPFSYDELTRPLVQYKEAYDKVEQDYSTLAAQTETWKNIANQTKNPEAYKQYKAYSDELNNVIEDFSKGMNARNRSALLGLKRRYFSDIAPIARAYERQRDLSDKLQQAKLQNPYLETEYDVSNMSIDDFMRNPEQHWGRVANGAVVAQQVAEAAAALAQQVNTQEGRNKLHRILPFTYSMLQKNGFTYDEVLKAMRNDPEANNVLTGLVQNAIKGTGVYNWQGIKDKSGHLTDRGQQIINRLTAAGNTGLWKAIGKDTEQVIRDEYGMKMAEMREQSRLRAAEARQAAALNGLGDLPSTIASLHDQLIIGDKSLAGKKTDDAKILGLTKDGKNLRTHINFRFIDLMPQMSSTTGISSMGKDHYKAIQIWGQNGKLLTENQFVHQGKDNNEKRQLRDYYRGTLLPAKKRLVTRGAVNERNSAFTNYKSGSKTDSGNYAITGVRFNTSDNATAMKSGQIGSYLASGKAEAIKGYNEKGLITGGTLTKKELDKLIYSDPDKHTLGVSGSEVDYHLIFAGNKPGVAITIKKGGRNHQFLIPKEALSSQAQRSFDTMSNVENSLTKQVHDFTNKYGRTPSKGEIEYLREQVYRQYGSAALKQLNLDLQGQYTEPKISTYKNED